ncbi:unnamed protein product [Amoebophrya sp. A25]|nr:unnamed protein product [Amoebophrya sp. A25]|eukprot:GSA25T00020510001.1
MENRNDGNRVPKTSSSTNKNGRKNNAVIVGATVRASSSTAPSSARPSSPTKVENVEEPSLIQSFYGNTSNYLELSRAEGSPTRKSRDAKLAQDYEALLKAHKRVLLQVETLQNSKVSAIEHDLLTSKYRRALSQIEALENREIAAEEVAEKDLEIQDLRLQAVDLRKKLRLSVANSLELMGVPPDTTRNPYALFDEYEQEISALKAEMRALQDRNVRLSVELEKFQTPFGTQSVTSLSDPKGVPKFVRELQKELNALKKREEEFSRSERSNRLVSRCVAELTQKLSRAEKGLQDATRRADLTEKKADASEQFLEKILTKARATETELESEKRANEGLEAEVAGLKEACFHQTQYRRQESLLTKFLPLSKALQHNPGVGPGGASNGQASGQGTNTRARSRAASQSPRFSSVIDLGGDGGGGMGNNEYSAYTDRNSRTPRQSERNRQSLIENFSKLHQEITKNPDLKFVIPLSSRVKAALDGLLRQHTQLEQSAASALQVIHNSAAAEVRQPTRDVSMKSLRETRGADAAVNLMNADPRATQSAVVMRVESELAKRGRTRMRDY